MLQGNNTVYYENYVKYVNTPCTKSGKFLNGQANGVKSSSTVLQIWIKIA